MHLEYFSISEGGPFNKAVQKIGLNTNAKQIVVALCITWLPLLIITAFEGTIYSGVSVPFLKDVSIHVRLLIVLPILLTIKAIINSKSIDLEKYFSNTLMNDKEKQTVLNRELQRVKRLINSAVPEIIFLLIIIALTISPFKGGILHETTSWRVAVEGRRYSVKLCRKMGCICFNSNISIFNIKMAVEIYYLVTLSFQDIKNPFESAAHSSRPGCRIRDRC